MFDGPSNDQSDVKPEKVIHEPNAWELEELAVALYRLGISSADRVLLVWGRSVFDEDWISDQTKNWLAILDDDMKKYEDATDPQLQQIFGIMVELDYKALRGNLYMDAMWASAKLENIQRSKVRWSSKA